MTPSEQTSLYGLVGDPVSHSMSPFIMNRGFAEFNIDATYVAFGIRPELFFASVGGLIAQGIEGFNVTFPYKEEVLFHVEEVSTEAEIIGAVNTVVVDEDQIIGHNTDCTGTAIALETFTGIRDGGDEVFIFGGGGAARAAGYGLLAAGARRVTFGIRDMKNAGDLIDRLAYTFPEQSVEAISLSARAELDVARRRSAIRDSQVVINATPVGMAGNHDVLLEDPSWIRTGQVYFDFVYYPRQTRFLETAREYGAQPLGGVALLVAQASESFRLWTGSVFDVQDMAAAVESFSQPGVQSRREVN